MSRAWTNSAFACGEVVVIGILPSPVRFEALEELEELEALEALESGAGAAASFLAQPETVRTTKMRSGTRGRSVRIVPPATGQLVRHQG